MPGCPDAVEVARILGAAPLGLEGEARRLYGCDPAHGWPHIVRVARWSRWIVEEEGLRPDAVVLYLAVLLHDAGRSLGGGHHAVESARYARRVLPGLGLPGGVVERVAHAILAHSYSLGVRPESLEAKILSDADKLDALGAVGIARAVHTGCTMGRGLEGTARHMEEKLLRLPGLMHFPSSRREAERLAERVRVYLEWLRGEGITWA